MKRPARSMFALALALSLGTDVCLAGDSESQEVSPSPTLEVTGKPVLPKGTKSAVWLQFMNWATPSGPSTERVKRALESHGWGWASDRESAAVEVIVSGYARIHNELKGNRDTGRIEAAEILDHGYTDDMGEPKRRRGSGGVDLGIAQQAAGAGAGAVGGVGAAFGLGWLADVTGLREAINNTLAPDRNTKTDAPWWGEPLFCFSECQRKFSSLHHIVELHYQVKPTSVNTWAPPLYSVKVSMVTDKRTDVTPMIETALDRMLKDLTEVQEQ